MTTDNINFPRNHMLVRDGYFYYFDERNNTLNKKVSDGASVAIYSLTTSLGLNQVDAIEYDGTFFWTLQEGVTDEDSIIKKWLVKDAACVLYDSIDLTHDADNKFRCPAFSLEYYTTALANEVLRHSSEVTLQGWTEKIVSGTVLSLGPNSLNQYEDVTVTGTLPGIGRFGLDFYTSNSYGPEDTVVFAKSMWLVNHFLYLEPGGALYEVTLPNKRISAVVPYEELAFVNACCFYNTIDIQYIVFVIGTVARFFNLATLEVDKSMFIDNVKTDQVSVITIHDLKVAEGSLFRLQDEATYFDTDYTFAMYNYQCSPLRSFVDSVTIDVYPKVLPSNGFNVSDITTFVKDQYSNASKIKPVTFIDDDQVGFITTVSTYTDTKGKAVSSYKAGVTPGVVTITVTVTQYD